MPGSHGPKQSGSVIVPTLVPTHTSTISLGSNLIFFVGGGLVLSSQFDVLLDDEFDDEFTEDGAIDKEDVDDDFIKAELVAVVVVDIVDADDCCRMFEMVVDGIEVGNCTGVG